MSQQLNTSVVNDGENEVSQYLKAKGVSADTIQKLLENELNTLDLLRSIEDDLDEVVSACKINVIQKVKLRSAIYSLSQVIVDKEEIMAVLEMENKLKMLQSSIQIVAATQKDIDDQVTNYTNTITSTFKQLHELLNKRQTDITETLHVIANEKKQKLQNLSVSISQHTNQAQQKTNLCRKRLKKSIELNEIEVRKKEILQIANEVAQIKVITKDDTVIVDNKIHVLLDATSLSQSISTFGNVSVAGIPKIISLEDTKNCGIKVKWKLSCKPEIKGNEKIGIEWIEAKYSDQDDAKWNLQELRLNNIQDSNESVVDKIPIKGDTETFVVKMRYFQNNQWSIYSNSLNVQIIAGGYEKLLTSSMIKDPTLLKLFFETVLPDSLKHKRFTLLLRGSQHGFDLQAFKNQQCFDQPSLLIIMTSKEYDRVFGGYTSTGWKENKQYQNDAHAFMYSLSEKQNIAYRFPVKDPRHAIYHTATQMWRFGGNDIRWNPKMGCNGEIQGHYDYSSLGTDKNKTQITGGKPSCVWNVKDYEVWQLK